MAGTSGLFGPRLCLGLPRAAAVPAQCSERGMWRPGGLLRPGLQDLPRIPLSASHRSRHVRRPAWMQRGKKGGEEEAVFCPNTPRHGLAPTGPPHPRVLLSNPGCPSFHVGTSSPWHPCLPVSWPFFLLSEGGGSKRSLHPPSSLLPRKLLGNQQGVAGFQITQSRMNHMIQAVLAPGPACLRASALLPSASSPAAGSSLVPLQASPNLHGPHCQSQPSTVGRPCP